MPTQFIANVVLADDIFVSELSLLFLSYRVLWDKGTALDLLIFDPDCGIHKALEGKTGDPTPSITFQLEYEPSQGMIYKNKGKKHKLYILKLGQVLTPLGLCLRIRAVDKGSINLRGTVLNLSATAVKASDFCQTIASKVGIPMIVPGTGDNAGVHRAVRAKPIDVIRYELDRVLSASGKPISLQFDDREKQQLVCYEELYGATTSLLSDSLSGGTYAYGQAAPSQGSAHASYGNAFYHWEMDQDYRSGIWGHVVSVDHLTARGEQVTGEVKAKLINNLGIKGEALVSGGTRLHVPMTGPDSATSDDYYAKAVMTNAVFQNEMSITRGCMLVDADFAAYDGSEILNRKHIKPSLTGGTGAESKHTIIPNEAVIMGFEHRLNRTSAYTKVHLRRGT